MNPFFSIIIPTFNRAHVISKTISSVINQSFIDWELIVVDDGSQDNTKEVIYNYMQSDSRIKYVYQKNQERSVARNNGIDNSRGKYICFLDSDDEYMEHHLQTFHDEILSTGNPIGMFFTSLVIYNNGVDINHPIPKLMEEGSVFDYLFKSGIYPCRVCIEKSIFETFRFRLDCIIVEDTILWLEIASKYPIYQILKKTVNYFQHEENSVNKKFNPCKKMLNGIRNFSRNNKEVYYKISRNNRSNIIGELYYGISFSNIINNNRLYAIYYMICSLLINPFNEKLKHKIFILINLILFRKLTLIKTFIQ